MGSPGTRIHQILHLKSAGRARPTGVWGVLAVSELSAKPQASGGPPVPPATQGPLESPAPRLRAPGSPPLTTPSVTQATVSHLLPSSTPWPGASTQSTWCTRTFSAEPARPPSRGPPLRGHAARVWRAPEVSVYASVKLGWFLQSWASEEVTRDQTGAGQALWVRSLPSGPSKPDRAGHPPPVGRNPPVSPHDGHRSAAWSERRATWPRLSGQQLSGRGTCRRRAEKGPALAVESVK